MTRDRVRLLLMAGAGLAFGSGPARADPQDIVRFAPLQMESAIPVRPGVLETELTGRMVEDRHGEAGTTLGTVEPLVRLGVLRNLHVTVAAPYRLGDQGTANQGEGAIGGVLGLTDQGRFMPALGIAATYATPFGAGHKTAEVSVRGLATKYLGDEHAPRLHLNVAYTHLDRPGEGERPDRFAVIAGGSVPVRPGTAVFLEVVHGARPERRQRETLLEAAVRHELGPWLVSAGAGVGVTRDSPAYRLLFSLSREFHAF